MKTRFLSVATDEGMIEFLIVTKAATKPTIATTIATPFPTGPFKNSLFQVTRKLAKRQKFPLPQK